MTTLDVLLTAERIQRQDTLSGLAEELGHERERTDRLEAALEFARD